MSIEMSDGSIMPAHVFVSPGQVASRNDPCFRVGKVVAVYYPTDQANYSQKYIEYDVMTDFINPMGVHTNVLYPRCKVLSLFGGAADFTDWTYRLSDFVNAGAQSTNGPGNTVDYGDNVGILCVNGDVRQGVIIGGVKHIALTNNSNYTPTMSDGHHLNFEFNGIVVQINDAGELTVTFNGKTAEDGTLDSSANSSDSGSNLKLSKDGSFSVQSPTNDQNITIDNTNTKMDVTANSSFNLNVTGGQCVIKSTGLQNGAATDALLLGTSFRQAQTIMDTQISASITSIASLLEAVSIQLTIAGSILTIPIIGNLIAGPMIAAAGGQLASVPGLLETWGSAIETFEAQTYLSLKNNSD
jgi:hypothetical protein